MCMFGWFSPRCPVETWAKAWTETRMLWLADRLGVRRLVEAEVVLPTDEYFPEPYRGTEADARRMLGRLCDFMGLDPGAVRLRVSPDFRLRGAAECYERQAPGERSIIHVAESQFQDPQALIATLAHELAHEILLGGGLLDADVPDHEWITDLLMVYLGVGVFAANSALREEYQDTGAWSRWSIGKQGYLPARVFGYAMALFAFLRDEPDPSWANHLRPDAASALRGGLRYLHKTGDSLFHPETVAARRGRPTQMEAAVRLRSGTPAARLAALWEVQEHSLTGSDCLEAVTECLGHRDPAVAGEAARALARFGAAAAPAVPALLRTLWSPHAEARAGAAEALGELGLQAETVVPELCVLLGDRHRAVFTAAAAALGQFAVEADPPSIRRLLAALEVALVECDYPQVDVLARALLAVTANPARCVADYFAGGDGELRRLALAALAQQRSAGTA
jgi:hypothetical protein